MRVGSPQGLRLMFQWLPLAVGISIVLVVQRATGRPIDGDGLGLFLCGIVAAYSLDRVLDPSPRLTGDGFRLMRVSAGLIASAGCALFTVRLPIQTGLLAPVFAAIALSYPLLKKLPLTKTIVVALVWVWSAIAFPFSDGSWFGWRWIVEPVSLPLLLLVAASTLLCDLKDADTDRQSSVGSLPVLLGLRETASVGVALALAAAALTLGHRPGLTIAGIGLAIAGLRPGMLATDAIGPVLVDGMLVVPGLLIAARLI